MEDRIAKLMADWSAWVAVAVLIYGLAIAGWTAWRLSGKAKSESTRMREQGRSLRLRLGGLIIILALAGLVISLYWLNHDAERLGEQYFAFWLGLIVAGIVAAIDEWLIDIGGALALTQERPPLLRGISSAMLLPAAFALLPIHHTTDGYERIPLQIALSVLLGAALGTVLLRAAGLVFVRRHAEESGGLRPMEGAGVEIYLAIASGLVAAEALGRARFPKELAALSYPYGVIAVALLAGLIGMWLVSDKRTRLQSAIPLGIAVLLIGGAGYLFAERLLHQPRAFYSLAIGLISGILLWWMTASQVSRGTGPDKETPGIENALMAAVMIAGSIVLPFRMLGGYGIGLSAIGMLSLLPLAYAIEGFRRFENIEAGQSSPAPFLLFPARAVGLGAGIVLATAFLRVITESYGLRSTITIDALYPLVGLIIGGSLPLLLRASILHTPVGSDLAEHQIANAAVFAALKIAFWGAAAPLLIALFFGNASVGGFLAGMIAGELFALLALYLIRNADALWAGNLALIVWMTVVAVRLGPVVGDWSASMPRGQKIHVLLWLAGIAIVWIILSTLFHKMQARRQSSRA